MADLIKLESSLIDDYLSNRTQDLFDRVKVKYLLLLRRYFIENKSILNTVASALDRDEKIEKVFEIVKNEFDPETEKILRLAISVLIDESFMSVSELIIDESTGMPIARLSDENLFKPKDFEIEGKTIKSTPILDPGLSIEIVNSKVEKHKEDKISSYMEDNEDKYLSLAHIKDFNKILEVAKHHLLNDGYHVFFKKCEVEKIKLIKIGQENINSDDDFCRINKKFHRFSLYGELLYKKIKQEIGVNVGVVFDKITKANDRIRFSWYEVQYSFISEEEFVFIMIEE